MNAQRGRKTHLTMAIGISIPIELLPLVDLVAKRQGRSRSSYISYVLAEALRSHPKKLEKVLDIKA